LLCMNRLNDYAKMFCGWVKNNFLNVKEIHFTTVNVI
jgi:hypothetical protein